MAAGLRLELRQSQQLVMTPQLQQAIKLLQMSNFELSAFVSEEIERNPLLTGAAPDDTPTPPEADPPRQERADERVTPEGDHGLAAETFDTGTENLYDAAPSDSGAAPAAPGLAASTPRISRGNPAEDGEDGFEHRLTRPTTLREHLLGQVGLLRAPSETRALAARLVEELDEAGYLRSEIAELAARWETDPATLEQALALLQSCEPTGVGARTLAECLALQLAERNRLDPAIAAFLDHLPLLAEGKLARLQKLCGATAEDIADMLADLRRLDPRPGSGFAPETVETLIPDLLVRPDGWGGWEVELNPDALPQVLIDRSYAARLSAGGEQTKRYLATCRDEASWLVKSLDQRARTILKVAIEIVRQQGAFFAEGPRGLKPLSLKMVAEAIGMHESTVSRVTAKKYMATERGIFELKFFFSNAVGGGTGPTAGDATSAEAVRSRLRTLVDAERPGAVLSDDRIVEILQGEGIEIARRTVAKYRASLGIPSSAERKRRLAIREVL
ncbi:MAG: RNA polymerase factor sigma-54 [Pikeienuella sp.]